MKNKKTYDYHELTVRQRKEFEAFPIVWAFSDQQLEDGIRDKFGMELNEAKDKILSLGMGGFILKTDADRFGDLIERHHAEREDALNDENYLYEGFLYELGNHEFCITFNAAPAIEAVGLTEDKVIGNERFESIFLKARSAYMKSVREYNEAQEVA